LKDVLQSFESIKNYNQENQLFHESFDDDLENELAGINMQRNFSSSSVFHRLFQESNGFESALSCY
jgi:hypothetical protein